MSADGAGGGGGTKQRFELYIKASAIDKETKGSCPICQHWFMITCLLGESQDDIDFKVYTVQADCPPKNFGVEQGWSKKFPVIMVLEGRDKRGQDLAGTKYDTFEELETFFESINRELPELKRKNAPNVAAMQAVEDVYNAFNTSLSAGKTNKRLSSALKKINEFLESDSDCRYLVDNTLSFADCYLLPRLQHIRVAGKTYLSYDIPPEHLAIWKYLADAYQTEAFRSTMPSDQDIVFHYEKKAGHLLKSQKRCPRPTLQNFTYTLDIPEEIALMLQGSATSTNGDASQPSPPTEQVAAVDISPQQQEEVVPESQEQQAVVSADTEEVAAYQECVVAGEGDAVDQAVVDGASTDAVDQAVVDGASMDEAAYEVPTVNETANEAVTAEEAVAVNASPIVADDNVGAEDTVAADEGQTTEREGSNDADVTGDGDDETTVTADADTVGGSEAVSDNTTAVGDDAADDAAGVQITVHQEQVVDVKSDMGNGVVVKEKGDTDSKDDVIKADDGVANVDGKVE